MSITTFPSEDSRWVTLILKNCRSSCVTYLECPWSSSGVFWRWTALWVWGDAAPVDEGAGCWLLDIMSAPALEEMAACLISCRVPELAVLRCFRQCIVRSTAYSFMRRKLEDLFSSSGAALERWMWARGPSSFDSTSVCQCCGGQADSRGRSCDSSRRKVQQPAAAQNLGFMS